ncbi:hypothetical protein BBO99_00005191 [Phytophthora kernoviae]|uniref:SWIM-type domain-containing protein n=2 Tax=Phytophthora kernoviae TaxID=325452 RepID=A0A3R7KTY3_9STRA|nr:hypothetical protein G195_005899 [Phytophthora kernoviae 00238/432]KAG2524200.1 hypothetical protein JM16_005103 [Phytophthora kernoviae]KAG2525797.1 hypothetical protein JM18_004716 [Phytophthora kernoviae]RLN43535.1 hypothetical protein BBI17_005835 [Phytophthora kernoviae]RLN79539.1 hypothetical protein BBO99_00005191 [Phytophthora kernoviae]
MTTPTVTLRKDDRFVNIADAVAVVEAFAEKSQQRHVRIQQRPNKTPPATLGFSTNDSAPDTATTTVLPPNALVLECENAPNCKWFVRLILLKSEQKWKVSSMNLTHSKINCLESKYITPSSDSVGFQSSLTPEQLLSNASASANAAAADAAVSSGATAAAMGASVYVGMVFLSWKEAISAIRALAHQLGRRAVAEKAMQIVWQDKNVIARRVICQNHRNSNCEWMIVLDEAPTGTDRYTVLSMHLLHSKECLETCNFNARKKVLTPAVVATVGAEKKDTSVNGLGLSSGGLKSDSSLGPSLLVDDISKYQLTHEMRWSTGKEATKAISDFTLVVQRKRSKLCKRNNGGSNKKYVCSDEQCLWFVQLVKGWKSKNWKISAMNLKHSETCTGVAKPTARQLAEMRFFRQAVITHSKSSGKLLTDNFLMNSESGIQIPRGMAYRAQRMVVATSTDDLTESYKYIPSLVDSFVTKNPGSIANYEKDAQGHFTRSFIMPFGSAILTAQQQIFGIHVLHYDTVSYHGCLALLITRDGNFQYQVVAFALLPTSEMEHMTWFIEMAKSGGAQFDGNPVYCSHSQHGLLRALANEARNAKIMFCVRSLLEEMGRDKNIPPLGALDELVWELQRQETEESFLKVLGQLETLNAAAAEFLRTVNAKNWAYYLNRSVKLYHWASTGADEALLGSDIQVSDEAPFDLMYTFLAFLMDDTFKKSQLSVTLMGSDTTESQPQSVLTPGADGIYRQELQTAEDYVVRLCDEQVAFTWCKGARPKITQRVDLAVPTCTCGQMFQLGLPCRHFIAVSIHFGNDIAILNGFDSIYKAAMYAELHRNVRIEIPTADDLHKDQALHPAASARSSEEDTSAPPTKTPRLEFDVDAVSSLTELV